MNEKYTKMKKVKIGKSIVVNVNIECVNQITKILPKEFLGLENENDTLIQSSPRMTPR